MAQSPEDYADLAVRIAKDSELGMHLRSVQNERAAALYGDEGAVSQIGDFLVRAVRDA